MFSTVKIKLAPVAARNDGMQRIDDRHGPLKSRADDARAGGDDFCCIPFHNSSTGN